MDGEGEVGKRRRYRYDLWTLYRPALGKKVDKGKSLVVTKIRGGVLYAPAVVWRIKELLVGFSCPCCQERVRDSRLYSLPRKSCKRHATL